MIEHRLIEKMIHLLDDKIKDVKEKQKIEPHFVDLATDFVRTYADRTHHGKEEDILFKALENKDMSEKDRKMMDELIEEHKYGRKLLDELVKAKETYVRGEKDALSTIIDRFEALIDMYPGHIEKEDRLFFPAAMEYFTQEEQDTMLDECWEFDRNMIHEKYKILVENLEESG
jgi:hemerythrin-like domain-containing protein